MIEELVDVVGATEATSLRNFERCDGLGGDSTSEVVNVPPFCVDSACCGVCDSFPEGDVGSVEFSRGLSPVVRVALSEGRRDEERELEQVSVGVLWREVDSVVQPDLRERLSFCMLSC